MFHEKSITKLIIALPIVFILITVTATILISIQLLESHFKNDIIKAKQTEVNLQKQYIKNQIEIVYDYIEQKKVEAPRRLKKELIQRVSTGLGIANKLYALKKDKIPEQQLRKEILETLRNIRYGNNGYYFVAEITKDNKVISRMLPSTPDKENIYAHQLQDIDGKYYVKEFANIVTHSQNNEGFVEYKWKRINSSNQSSKISFVKLFKPYNWFIGFGEYYDDFNHNIKEEAKQRLDQFRFGNNGYVWTHDTNHKLIQHPFRNHHIGKNDFNLTDKKETKVIQLFVKKALENKNGSFIEYYWNKPNKTELTKKIGYVKHIKDWNWIIGSGIYVEDIEFSLHTIKKLKEEEIQNNIINLIITSSIILMFAILFSYFISKKINQTLYAYRKNLFEKQNELARLNDSLSIRVERKTKELKKLNNSLEETIENRVQEIKQKDAKLLEQSKMVALGEMIGNISHQWRQPLSAISTSASGLKLKQEMNLLTKDDINSFSDAIVDNANYLSQVIEDFKNYIKDDKVKENFNIADTIKKSLNIVNSSIHNHHITLILDLEESINIESYQNELVQALVNIFTNSKDAYVINNISDNNRYIFIELSEENNKAVIKIKDCAGGIKKDILEKIFEPYFTTKDKNQGTGLGLYMTYQIIVKSIQGSIEA